MGHSGTGAISQPNAHVLSRSTGCNCCLWHNKYGMFQMHDHSRWLRHTPILIFNSIFALPFVLWAGYHGDILIMLIIAHPLNLMLIWKFGIQWVHIVCDHSWCNHGNQNILLLYRLWFCVYSILWPIFDKSCYLILRRHFWDYVRNRRRFFVSCVPHNIKNVLINPNKMVYKFKFTYILYYVEDICACEIVG